MQGLSYRVRIALVCMIVAVLSYAGRRMQFDDALIYARCIRNALRGYGMVFNPGQNVNTLASPLFSTLLLLASKLLGGHILLAEVVLSGTALAGAAIVAEMLVPWSGLLVASTAYFYLCTGTETALFLCLLGLLTYCYLHDRLQWLPLLAVLAMLTRLEAVALVAVLVFHLVREKRWPPRPAWTPAVCVVLAYLANNYLNYGRFLPSTLAMLRHGSSEFWGRGPSAFLHPWQLLPEAFHSTLFVIPVALVPALLTIWRHRTSPLTRTIVPFCLILLAFYLLFHIPGYHRHYAPFLYFGLIFAVWGLPAHRLSIAGLGAAVACCLVTGAVLLRTYGRDPLYGELGPWVAQNTPTSAHIAATEAGTIGWYGERYTDDILGLTDPRNAELLAHDDTTGWLKDDRPDYVIVHRNPTIGERAAVDSHDYILLPVHFGELSIMRRKDLASAPSEVSHMTGKAQSGR